MHAKDHSLEAVLSERQQWVIPVYQRHYAWDTRADKQLPALWDDIRDRAVEVLEGRDPSPHFVGAIIYSEPADKPFGAVNQRFLVDGQQRISTFSLALCAIGEVAEQAGIAQIANGAMAYVFNETGAAMEDPEREKFKLWSSSHDRPYYVALANGGIRALREMFPEAFYQNGKLNAGRAPKMISAYWFLVKELTAFIDEQSEFGHDAKQVLAAVLRGFLFGFQIVVVQLGRNDDAQSIFASLNGNAEPLSAFDLIRNNIFHRAQRGLENEDALYEGNWKRLETPFWKTEVKQGRLKRPRTDHLVAHSLVAEKAQEINLGQVANEYRLFAEASQFASVEQEIDNLLSYADIYETLERQTTDAAENRISVFLSAWDVSAFHPLVMWIGRLPIDKDAKAAAYRLIETYMIRRDLCGLTRKNYNKVVPGLLRAVRDSQSLVADLLRYMHSLEGDGSKLPGADDAARAVASEPLYNTLGSRKLRYILRELELHQRGKFDEKVSIDTDNLTVEHILPQKWAENWVLPNGERCAIEESGSESMLNDAFSLETSELMESRQRLLHTLGNLTLVTDALNPALGNSGWNAKKGYFASSLLKLNKAVSDPDVWQQWNPDLGETTLWCEAVIKARGRALASLINEVWTEPELTILENT